MTRITQHLTTTKCAHQQRGVSLIELMVALTIGLILMAGLITLITNTNQSYSELTKASRQLENGRYAVQLLKESIQHAGFYGEYSEADTLTLPGALPSPCLTTPASIDDGLPLHIQGYNAPASAASVSCLDDANHVAGTDILVIRRATTSSTAVGTLDQGTVYIQTRGSSFVLDVADDGTNNPTTFNLLKRDGFTVADIRDYRVEIYYVSPCNVHTGSTCSASSDDGRPIPTLKRLVLSSVGTTTSMVTEPLVEGIENFQIEYGIDRSGDGIPNESATGANDEYVVAPATTTDWSNVVSARIYLLARNTELSAGYSDNKTYNLGLAGSVATPGDAYKRHLFSTAVRLVNPAGRRES